MKNRDSLFNLDDMEDYYIANARVSFYQGILQGLKSAKEILFNLDDMEDYYIANAIVSYYEGLVQGLKDVKEIVKENEGG